MSYDPGSKLGRRLCELFDLDANDVTGMQLTITPGALVTLDVKMLVKSDRNDGLVDELRRYELKPAD